MNHALHVSTLPQHHRDPFDRLLIAQAQLEGLPVLSSDHQLANYQVEVIWWVTESKLQKSYLALISEQTQ